MKKALTLISIILLFSCSNMIDSDQSLNFEWLDVENPTENLSELSPSDFNRVMTAMERIKISFDTQGAAILETKSGKEINVSSDVYRYIVQIISKNNEHYGGISKRRTLLTRSETEEGNNDNNNNNNNNNAKTTIKTDCVAYVIANASSSFRLPDVRRRIESQFGTNGVRSDRLNECLNIFGQWTSLQVTDHFDAHDFHNRGIVVYEDIDDKGNKFYHAVNLNKTLENYVIGFDYQNPSGKDPFTVKALDPKKIKEIYVLTNTYAEY